LRRNAWRNKRGFRINHSATGERIYRLAIKRAGNQAGNREEEEIEAYLAAIPEPGRTTLLKVRAAIRAAAPPEATEGFSYGVPAFKLKKPLAGYTARKDFCSYYPMSGRVITALREDLKNYEITSGSIHFSLDKPLPSTLIKKLIRARLAEIEKKK
jgi:uncharacterized protein YdhG (YjbR/CyaY superfamily)